MGYQNITQLPNDNDMLISTVYCSLVGMEMKDQNTVGTNRVL